MLTTTTHLLQAFGIHLFIYHNRILLVASDRTTVETGLDRHGYWLRCPCYREGCVDRAFGVSFSCCVEKGHQLLPTTWGNLLFSWLLFEISQGRALVGSCLVMCLPPEPITVAKGESCQKGSWQLLFRKMLEPGCEGRCCCFSEEWWW